MRRILWILVLLIGFSGFAQAAESVFVVRNVTMYTGQAAEQMGSIRYQRYDVHVSAEDAQVKMTVQNFDVRGFELPGSRWEFQTSLQFPCVQDDSCYLEEGSNITADGEARTYKITVEVDGTVTQVIEGQYMSNRLLLPAIYR